MTSAEQFYEQLDSVAALEKLIGQPEDADFDCKEWSSSLNARRGSLAKAACGFTNATGGVIIIGMKASGRGSDTPDVVRSFAPVHDRMAVASEALDIILKFVEPGIEGVRWKDIPGDGEKAGFVVIHVPTSAGAPRRSKCDWRFYVRIATGTLPMEYFQIEDRFGKRPHPMLKLHLEPQPIQNGHGYRANTPLRLLKFALSNEGRGIAKFPGIRFRRFNGLFNDEFGIDGNSGFGIPPRASEPDWLVFRGGVDDVIYPGETRLVGKLGQLATNKGERGIAPEGVVVNRFDRMATLWVCEQANLEFEISAEDSETKSGVYQLQADSLTVESPVHHRQPKNPRGSTWS